MLDIKDYKQVKYKDFQKELKSAFNTSDKSYIKLASEIGVNSIQTAKNLFKEDKQIVSDLLLTKAMKSVGLNGLAIWYYGNKYYYLKNK